jgi:hypothetical protein
MACVLALSGGLACAADDDDIASTNRDTRPIEELFKTDVVYPQEKGELEAEVSTVYQNRSSGDAWSVPLSLEYGLTDSWQVEAEWNSFMQQRIEHGVIARGIGDVEIGTQYSFMNIGDSLFHIAPRFSVEIPVGDVNKDLSEGFVEYEPAVILARDFPELNHSQLFTEIGTGFVQRVKRPADSDDAEPAAHELDFGAGFFTLFPHGAASLEFNWTNNQWNNHGTENELYLTPGVLWRVAKSVELGVGIPVGLNRQSDRFDVSAHLTCEF